MTNDKGILIKNIYYMLTYAFQILRQKNYNEIAAEKFDEVQDLFAAILAKGISQQLKHGLYRVYDERILIIDTKYYGRTMQTQYDTTTLHSSNLYQIFTYVKNEDKDASGRVSGMLLYAKTSEAITPDSEYNMGGNLIIVKTLDLNCEFLVIAKQLDSIINKFLGVPLEKRRK